MVCRELGTCRVGPPYPYMRSWGVPRLTERKAEIGTFCQERAVYNHPPCDLSTFKTRVSGMGCLGREEPARGQGWGAVPQQPAPGALSKCFFCRGAPTYLPKAGVLPESGCSTFPQSRETKPPCTLTRRETLDSALVSAQTQMDPQPDFPIFLPFFFLFPQILNWQKEGT